MGKFVKGGVANPKGRGTETEHRKRVASELLSPHVKRAVEVIASSLESTEPPDRQWAAKIIMEYCFGKPAQALHVQPGDGIKSFRLVIEGAGE